MIRHSRYVIALSDLSADDVDWVGGKNASLGEMIHALRDDGIAVPPGFATTVAAYGDFLKDTGTKEVIGDNLKRLKLGKADLAGVSKTIRGSIIGAEMPTAVRDSIVEAYCELGADDVAVRSSATAEDLPDASFAGQQETFLNVRGEEAVVTACKRCFASLFSECVMAYREEHGFDHARAALSIGVQRMVRSDIGCAGVMFTIDTETGSPDIVLIDGAWGLGEGLAQGSVDPDAFVVFKPLLADPARWPIVGKALGKKLQKTICGSGDIATCAVETSAAERRCFVLSDPEVLQLARWAVAIEAHFGRAMDIEWAKDGRTGEIYVVQAWPETMPARHARDIVKALRLGPERLGVQRWFACIERD